MSRSFFSRSSSSRDTSPLLPQHVSSHSLQDLSPRPSITSRNASPSPPPSFYRDINAMQAQKALSLSPSPSSRTKPRKIQFAAPPPPIAASVLLPPAQKYAAQGPGQRGGSVDGRLEMRSASPKIRRGSMRGGRGVDPLIGLERREKAVQAELQMLLDAQSAGLVQGFGGEADGQSEAGSSTPTSRSLPGGRSGSGVMPVRQPKKKVLGLRGARRGLLRSMEEMADVKREEAGVLMMDIGKREELLGKVGQWERRIEGVKSQLDEGANLEQENDRGEEATEIADLCTEEQALDGEIRDLEDRLAQMKARKRWLGERINENVNRREARLSSYRGALREVEAEVKDFLKRPPIAASVVMRSEQAESFFSLPPGRRTLGMAKEWWDKEVSELQLRREEVERERSALEDGAQMWRDCVTTVAAFEDDLRQQMANTEDPNAANLQAQVEKMGDVIRQLQSSLDTAEERSWNLLICAVGAELEAFKEGERILRGALEVVVGVSQEQNVDESYHTAKNGLNELNDVNGSQLRKEGSGLSGLSGVSEEREESEDDGPNLAELLVDRGGDERS